MPEANSRLSKRLMVVFTLMVVADWFYILIVQNLPDLITNAWFVLFPLMSYFYFCFALIALVGIYHNKRFGFSLAYGVIMFGTISTSISYSFAFKTHPLLSSIFVLLVLLNLLIGFYIAYQSVLLKPD